MKDDGGGGVRNADFGRDSTGARRAKKKGLKGGAGKDNSGGIEECRFQRYLKLTVREWLAVGLILAFVGVNLQLLTHIVVAQYFGITLILIGATLAIYSSRRIEEGICRTEPEDNIADRFIHFVTLKSRLKPWLPVLGIFIIVIVVLLNVYVSKNHEFQTVDWLMICLAAVFIVYPYIPMKYSTERNFALVLVIMAFVMFSFLFILPMIISYMQGGQFEISSSFVYWMLALPTSAIARMFGMYVTADGDLLHFQEQNGMFETLKIATTCSGIDSLVLFIAGFIAFVAVENQKMNGRLVLVLVGGILTAYFANLLRMTTIVAAGVYYGPDTMYAVHENVGIFIFLGWIALFWFLVYRFGMKSKRMTLNCASCGFEIDPDNIPNKCPNCENEFE